MARHLAIGDIHGCFTALQTLAKYVDIRSDDVVITLGDYVNRGPNSAAVVDWLIHQCSQGILIPLRGNHEIMMLNAREGREPYRKWLDVGGLATLNSYSPFDGHDGSLVDVPANHWQFLEEQLHETFETDRHFFVHANAYPDLPLDEQPDYMLYWEQFNDPALHMSGKIMVCGHTFQNTGLPVSNGNAICIDTWACGRGWLSCLHVESELVYQANELGEKRQFFLDEVA